MNYKRIKFNIFYFILSYVLLCIILCFINYKFFLNDFLLIEKEQNRNSVETFLNNINKNLENLKNSTNDYANWDATYEFMKNKNKKYIYENFRDGSQTLLEINLDSIMYLNLKNKVLFSRYTNEYLEVDKKDFENFLIEKFKDNDDLKTIVNYNSHLIYLFKSPVKNSDKTGADVGHIFSAKLIDDRYFSEKHTIFKNIEIKNEQTDNFDFDIDINHLNAKIQVIINDENLRNNIQFYTKDNEYIISIVTDIERTLIKNSKKTIFYFNAIACFIILLVFVFIYKNQLLISNQNKLLNKEVESQTEKLKNAYDEVNEKNKELYKLANIDTLTKIRNRRNYFLESKNLLDKSILNSKSLFVCIIDLDNFKNINDKYGHNIGDEVLISFSNIVSSIIDKETIFGRIGGEEFCLTFYDKSENEVNQICEEIREKSAKYILEIKNQNISFTISMGLSIKQDINESIDKILQRADEYLYEAKKMGKNRIIRDI